MIKITVKRNGAKNRMEMAKRFSKHEVFALAPLSEVLKSIRAYEKDNQFIITDDELTIIHYCWYTLVSGCIFFHISIKIK